MFSRNKKKRDLSFQETHGPDGRVKLQADSRGWYPLEAVSAYNQLNGANVFLYTGDGKWMEVINDGPNFWDDPNKLSHRTSFKITYLPDSTSKFIIRAWDSDDHIGNINTITPIFNGTIIPTYEGTLMFARANTDMATTHFSPYVCGSVGRQNQCAIQAYSSVWDNGNQPHFLKVTMTGKKCCDSSEFNGIIFTRVSTTNDVYRPPDPDTLFIHIKDKSPYVQAWENVSFINCCLKDERTFDDPKAEIPVRVCRDLKLRGRTDVCDQMMRSRCQQLRAEGKTDPRIYPECKCFNFIADLEAKGLGQLTIPIGCYPSCQVDPNGKVYRPIDVKEDPKCPTICANTINSWVDGQGSVTYTDVNQQCHISQSGGDGGSSDGGSSGQGDHDGGSSGGGGSGGGSSSDDYKTAAVVTGSILGLTAIAYLFYKLIFSSDDSSRKQRHS